MADDGHEEQAVAVAPPPPAELPEIKLFGRWSCDDVQISDMSLQVSCVSVKRNILQNIIPVVRLYLQQMSHFCNIKLMKLSFIMNSYELSCMVFSNMLIECRLCHFVGLLGCEGEVC